MKARSDTSPFLPFDANSLGDLLTHHFSGHWLVFLDATTAEKAKQYGEEATESFLTFLKANQRQVRFIPTVAIPDLMLTAPQPIMFIDLSLFRWIKALPFNVSNETAEPAVISYDDTPPRVLAYRPDSKSDGLFVYPLPDGSFSLITPTQTSPIYLQDDFADTRQPPLRDRHRDSSLMIATIPAGFAFCALLSPSLPLGASLKSVLFLWAPLTFALLGLHHLIHLLCPNHGRRLRLLIDTIKGKPNLFYRYRDKPTPFRTIALFLVEILGFLLLVAFFGFVFSHTFAPNANATRPAPDTQSQGVTDADLLAQLQRLHAIAQLQLIDVTTNAPPAAQPSAVSPPNPSPHTSAPGRPCASTTTAPNASSTPTDSAPIPAPENFSFAPGKKAKPANLSAASAPTPSPKSRDSPSCATTCPSNSRRRPTPPTKPSPTPSPNAPRRLHKPTKARSNQ